jgi:dipeptidyl aminopeptidase/acylaminoacyl peptidase
MMKPMRLAVLAYLTTGVFLAQSPSPSTTSWTPELTLQFQNVSNVTVSPDGKMVAWVQSKQVVETEKSEVLTHIWVAAADGSRRYQLTRGDKSASNPQWTQDSKSIVFTAARGTGPTATQQIYSIAVAGGEADRLTEFKGGIGSFAIAPDGKSVAFTGTETNADEEKAKKEKRDMRVIDQPLGNQTIYAIPMAADADGKRKQRKVVDAKYHVVNFNWSPDSKHIAYEHWPATKFENWYKADVSEVDVASGSVKSIAATPASESSPVYSPDGRFIALTRSGAKPRWAFENRIALVTRASGEARDLPATYDEQPRILGWAKDSSKVFFGESKRTRNYIGAMPVDGPPAVFFETARGVFNAGLNASGSHFGLTFESPDSPVEAYLMPVQGSATMQRVSRANVDIARPAIGRTEAIRWKSKDGLEVEGLLTYPVGYEKGQKVPLILNIHGGPTGVFNESFVGRSALYPIAVFASKGYAVLRPNPRGSSGYGKQFRFANYNDWGGKDYEDDQTGVDKVIEMGIADPDRLAIMGWSYGGFMTSWTITQTKRFKAAVVGAAVTNLWSFTGTADIPGFIPDYFGGEPWENFEPYRKHSPITHIKNVVTPTLVLHGEADDRVPVGQGYEYYNALKRQGGIAKMVVYPRTPHGPREPKFVLDIMQRHLDWVEQYVR